MMIESRKLNMCSVDPLSLSSSKTPPDRDRTRDGFLPSCRNGDMSAVEFSSLLLLCPSNQSLTASNLLPQCSGFTDAIH